VQVPTAEGRELVLSCYTHPEPAGTLLREKLRIELRLQLRPRITAVQAPEAAVPIGVLRESTAYPCHTSESAKLG
jgi:hypothetical protein